MSGATAELARYGCGKCHSVFRTGFARCPIDGEPVQSLIDDPLEGSTFADRYVIEEMVGEGAMGRVYRARHQRVSRQFAIKVLFGDHSTDKKMRERFAREAESASRLEHPNVISVVDFGEHESLLYLVMDFVEGRELDEAIATEAPMEPKRIERVLRDLCAGLDHAHREGLVHRDFKGANVLLANRNGRETARIVDFGLAVMSELAEADRITTEGIVFGTPAYMSPEQATGQELDHLTDLFALGVVLYEMLAGTGPFEGAPIELARQNITADPPPIAERVPGLVVDPKLEAIAHKLMAKKPSDRYQNAAAVIAELDRDATVASPAALSETVRGPAEPVTGPEPETRRRGPGLLLAGVVGVAALVGVGVVLVRSLAEDATTPNPEPTVVSTADAGIVRTQPPVEPPPARRESPPTTNEETDPKTTRLPIKRTKPTTKPEKRPPKIEEPRPATASKPVSDRSLIARFNAVNRAIRDYEESRGKAAAASLWKRFKAISINDAIQKPSIRADTLRTLRALERSIPSSP